MCPRGDGGEYESQPQIVLLFEKHVSIGLQNFVQLRIN